MPSFQIAIQPNRRAAARFVSKVRRAIQAAYAEEQKKRGLSQADIARALGVNRSVVNRELKGFKDITLGRVAELAWVLNRVPSFDLLQPVASAGQNVSVSSSNVSIGYQITQTATAPEGAAFAGPLPVTFKTNPLMSFSVDTAS